MAILLGGVGVGTSVDTAIQEVEVVLVTKLLRSTRSQTFKPEGAKYFGTRLENTP